MLYDVKIASFQGYALGAKGLARLNRSVKMKDVGV